MGKHEVAPARRPRGKTWRQDGGAATVWVLASGMLTILIALTVSAAGAVMVARHRASSAADLAALAGARRALEGRDAACARAAEIAQDNGARLIGCLLTGWDLTVTVSVRPADVAAFVGEATASARAGPVVPMTEAASV